MISQQIFTDTSKNKIQLTNQLDIDSSSQYTKITNSDYFPKHNIITIFIKHQYDRNYLMDCTNPAINNAVLKIYSATNFKLLKSIPFEHHNKYLVFDENTLLIYQVHAFTKSENSPYIKFFDLSKLEVVNQAHIPLQTRRLRYEQLVHNQNCKCDIIEEFRRIGHSHNIKSSCTYKPFNYECKHQFDKVFKANENELIFRYKHPLHNQNEENLQLWNYKTDKIREVSYTKYLGELSEGVISQEIHLKRDSNTFPQSFFCQKSQKTLHFLKVLEQLGENTQHIVQDHQNTFVIAEIIENEEQIKTRQVFKTSCPLVEYKEKQQSFFLNDDQTYLFAIVNPCTIDIFNFQSAKLIRTIKYPKNDKIQRITFFETMFSVLSVEIDQKERQSSDQENQHSKQAQFINIYLNDIESGKRLTRHSQIVEGYQETTKQFPVNFLFSYKKSQDKDFNILMTSFLQQKYDPINDNDFQNELFLFKVPLIENIQTPQLQNFENFDDNQIDWQNNKYICACGQYLQKNINFETEYQQEKSYNYNHVPKWSQNNPKSPYCHICQNDNIFWACSSCQYAICKTCRPEDKRDIKAKNYGTMTKIQPGDKDIICTTCTTPIKSEFYFTSNGSQYCLKCNEPEDWIRCRQYHPFKQIPKSPNNPCLKCGESKSNILRYNCESCDQTFCTTCLIQDIPQLIFHPQNLKPRCLNNHWLQVHKTTKNDSCVLCPQSDNKINDILHFSCKECKFSICQAHAPFHEDNIISPLMHRLILTPSVDETQKCFGCSDYLTEDIYESRANDCETKYCENCLHPKPRQIYEQKFLQKYNKQPICPKKHTMGLKSLETKKGKKIKCSSCNLNIDKKLCKYCISCTKCNYNLCSKCILIIPDNVRSEDGQYLILQKKKSNYFTCQICKDNSPTDYSYITQLTMRGGTEHYCTDCIDFKSPRLSPGKQDFLITELQQLQDQHIVEHDKEEEKVFILPEIYQLTKDPQDKYNAHKNIIKARVNKPQLEKCLKGHSMALDIVHNTYMNQKYCQICKTVGPRTYEIIYEDYRGCKRSVGFLLYKCLTCNNHVCSQCTHGFYSEIIPCKKGHQIKFVPEPHQGRCTICDGVEENIRYKCSKEDCVDQYCTKCLPIKNFKNKKPTKTVEQSKQHKKEKENSQENNNNNKINGKQLQHIDLEQLDSHQMETCPDGHNMSIGVINESYIDRKQCLCCKKYGLRQKEIKENGRHIGFILFNCDKCNVFKCVDCTQGIYSKIIPCRKGHKTELLPIPDRGNCEICKANNDFIRYSCKQCSREKFCEICFPIKSIQQKPTTFPQVQQQQQQVIITPQSQQQQKEIEEKTIKQEQQESKNTSQQQSVGQSKLQYVDLEQLDSHQMETCPDGHTMSIEVCNESYIDRRQCFCCKKYGPKQRQIKYNGEEYGRHIGFLLFKCTKCTVYKCLDCTQGLYSEIIPCRKGHKTEIMPIPDRGNCEICSGNNDFIRYNCKQCSRESYCELCFPIKSIEYKPKPITPPQYQQDNISESQLQNEQQNQTLQQQQQPQQQNKLQYVDLEQSDSHQMETFPNGHTMSIEVCNESYIDRRQCFCCKKYGPKQREIKYNGEEYGRHIGFLLFKCTKCTVYKCLDCTQGLHSEIIPCRKGHKTEIKPIPDRGNCEICSGNNDFIRYDCKQCSRESYCELCFPIKPIQQKPKSFSQCQQQNLQNSTQLEQKQEEETKQEEIPKQPQLIQSDSHQMVTCPDGHTMSIKLCNKSYIDRKQCFCCKKYSPRQKEIKERGQYHIGFLFFECSKCNLIKCLDCTQGLYSEIIPCRQGHKTELLPFPDQGNCELCKECAPNIQYKCPQCRIEKFCTECFPLKSIVDKPPPQEILTVENKPFVQKDNHQMEKCLSGHIMKAQVTSDSYINRDVCNYCNKKGPKDKEIRRWGDPSGRLLGYLYHECKQCNIIKCYNCTKGFYSEIVPCVKGHKTEFIPVPQQGNCNMCEGCAKNIQYKCNEPSCYREKYCTICFPLKSIYDKV